MSNTRAGPGEKQRAFKGGITARDRRKATVTGYVFAAQPVVEVRLFRDHRDQGQFIDMSLPQARELVRLLSDAIEGAADLARHDGSCSPAAGRAPAGRDQADVEQQARTRA